MWVNRNLLDAVGTLTDDQLRAPRSIGQGSLWKSLLHMYAAEWVWLSALEGNEAGVCPGDIRTKLPGNQEGENPIESLAELTQRWVELDERWRGYLDRLTATSLDDIVYRHSVAAGVRVGTRRSDVLLHVCTHAHYTAAQTINMLRQAGAEKFPDSMLVTLARMEST